MKRSALARKTPLQRTPMKKRRSAKARAKEFGPEVRSIILKRSSGMCERCRVRKGVHLHHALFRSSGGTGKLCNGILLCLSCHEACHTNREVREWAVKEAKRLAGGDPEDAHTASPIA